MNSCNSKLGVEYAPYAMYNQPAKTPWETKAKREVFALFFIFLFEIILIMGRRPVAFLFENIESRVIVCTLSTPQ